MRGKPKTIGNGSFWLFKLEGRGGSRESRGRDTSEARLKSGYKAKDSYSGSASGERAKV